MFGKLKEKFKQFRHNLQKTYASKVLGRKYIRNGKCKGCGNCCQSIYVRHSKDMIKDIKEFESLKSQHYFYTYLKVVETNETGLVFECTMLDKETGKCTAYGKRPLLCRQYPIEEIFAMGGGIREECGYSFTPIETFEDVFKKVNASLVKKCDKNKD